MSNNNKVPVPESSDPMFKPSITIPDPHERTQNDPSYLMSSGDVLKLGNMYNIISLSKFADTGILSPTKHLLSKNDISHDKLATLIDTALSMGWSEVKLMGKQLLFVNNF